MSGRARQLVTMVAENRPWRLVFGLRGALAAVTATGLYLVITSTIWQLASQLGAPKLVLTTTAAVAIMVAWILVAHDLWLGPDDVRDGEDAALRNATTLLTLVVGVVVMAATAFAFNLLVATFFLQPPLYVGSVADHVRLAWLATGFGMVGGALGSGLDSDAAVLRATYSEPQRRHHERRRAATG